MAVISLVENQHIYALINDTFKAPPEEISNALRWRNEYLEKRKAYNRIYTERIKANPERAEEAKAKCREWFQNNKARAAARQKARYENDPEYRQRLLEYKKMYYQKQQEKKKSQDSK